MVVLGIDVSKGDFYAALLLEDGRVAKHAFLISRAESSSSRNGW